MEKFENYNNQENIDTENTAEEENKNKKSFLSNNGMGMLAATLVATGAIDSTNTVHGAETNQVTSNVAVESAQVNQNTAEKITTSSLWAPDIINQAENMAKEVNSPEDARAFIKSAYGAFLGRWQKPNPEREQVKPIEVKGVKIFNEWSRIGTSADFKLISDSAESLIKIFQDVANKQKINEGEYQIEIEMLKSVKQKCADKISNLPKNNFQFTPNK